MYWLRKERYTCIDRQVYLFLWGDAMNEWIVTTAIMLGIGAITYFLKRTMNQVDRHGEMIQKIEGEMVTETDLKETIEELKKLSVLRSIPTCP